MHQSLFLPSSILVHSKEINVECNQQSSKLCAVTQEISPIETAALLDISKIEVLYGKRV